MKYIPFILMTCFLLVITQVTFAQPPPPPPAPPPPPPGIPLDGGVLALLGGALYYGYKKIYKS